MNLQVEAFKLNGFGLSKFVSLENLTILRLLGGVRKWIKCINSTSFYIYIYEGKAFNFMFLDYCA